MRSSMEIVSTIGRTIEVAIPAETFQSEYERFTRVVQKSAHIKGFRPGKAPLPFVQKMYHQRIVEDALDELVQMGFDAALKEHQVRPVGRPEIEIKKAEMNDELTFIAHFDVMPEITDVRFTDIVVEEPSTAVTEADIDGVVDRIRNSKAQSIEMPADYKAQNGDTVICDFHGYLNGELFEGGHQHDAEVEIGAGRYVPGFEEALIGLTTGSQHSAHIKFPEDYSAEELKGKTTEFRFDVKKIVQKQLPELTDAWAEQLDGGNFKTVVELKNRIRQDLEERAQKDARADFKENLIQALVRNNDIEVPGALISDKIDAIRENMLNRLEQENVPADFREAYLDNFKDEMAAQGKYLAQASTLFEAIHRIHGIDVSDDEVDAEVERRVANYPAEYQERMRSMHDQQFRLRLKNQMLEHKIVDWLAGKVQVIPAAKV